MAATNSIDAATPRSPDSPATPTNHSEAPRAADRPGEMPLVKPGMRVYLYEAQRYGTILIVTDKAYLVDDDEGQQYSVAWDEAEDNFGLVAGGPDPQHMIRTDEAIAEALKLAEVPTPESTSRQDLADFGLALRSLAIVDDAIHRADSRVDRREAEGSLAELQSRLQDALWDAARREVAKGRR